MNIEKKNLIIETAMKLFIKKGYVATKVEDITKAMNISKGNFYTYFKSKEDVLYEMIKIKKEEYKKKLAEINVTKERKEILREYFYKKTENLSKIFLRLNQQNFIEIFKNKNIDNLRKEMKINEKEFIKNYVLKKYEIENMDFMANVIFSLIEGFLYNELYDGNIGEVNSYFEIKKYEINELINFIDKGLKEK